MSYIRAFTRLMEKLSTVLFVVMTVVTFAQVVTRYTMGVSFFWAEELARFSMIWIAFLGAAIGVSQKAHTRIDFFINLLSPKVRKWVEVFDNIACLAFITVITYHSVGIIEITMKNLSTGLKIPMGIVYASLPVTGVMMIMYFIIQIFAEVKGIDLQGGAEK